MNLNYEALMQQSSRLFQLIREEQDTLRKSKITFSTYMSDESLKQLNNSIIKIGCKVPPEKLMDGAGALAALALANPALLIGGILIGGGALAVDAYQRNKAEQEARKALEDAFKYLVVNLEKINELLNQKLNELNQISRINFVRREKLQAEISALKEQISEIRSFMHSVSA